MALPASLLISWTPNATLVFAPTLFGSTAAEPVPPWRKPEIYTVRVDRPAHFLVDL